VGYLGDAVPPSERLVEALPIDVLALAVRSRLTGALALHSVDGTRLRRILMREGDLVNAASEVENETLMNFLVERGDLSPEVMRTKSAKLPQVGRHAAAALIANGLLSQDDLWPVLRAHAEWTVGRALRDAPALAQLEREPPERLLAEPNVFGGAAGVEIFIEAVRRVIPAKEALRRLGGLDAELDEGPAISLLAESALTADETDLVRAAMGSSVGSTIAPRGVEFAAVLYGLVTLGILATRRRAAGSGIDEPAMHDPLDADAVRQRVKARLALVHEGDYFSLLGVQPDATSYEIRRAYLELRRSFEPSRLLDAATADLGDDVALIAEVLEEAYAILRDPQRRLRYRRAIDATRSA
jgi:hypothetical protein